MANADELRGRVYLVAGGAGVAGEGVVAALLSRGAQVVVPSRSPANLARLRAGVPHGDGDRLVTLTGDVGDPTDAERVRDAVAAGPGRPAGVVASLGGWWEGETLLDMSMSTWHAIVRDNLTSHFVVARTFLPLLVDRPESVYVALAGIAARQPEPNAAPISVTGAAQSMLMANLAAELAGRAVRLHEVAVLTPIVTRRWEPGRPVQPGWLTGAQVGAFVADVVSPRFPRTDRLSLQIP